jgi:hypothetical protein
MSSQVYQVPSATNPGRSYRVTVHADGLTSCDCPDATYRRRQCKHQRYVLAVWTAAGRSGAYTTAAPVEPAAHDSARSAELADEYERRYQAARIEHILRGGW